MARKLMFISLVIAILGSGVLFAPGLVIRTVLASNGQVDEATGRRMLAATVQVELLAPVLDDTGQPVIIDNGSEMQMQYQLGEGLGTMVRSGQELVIVTHDHWSLLTHQLAKARFYSADNVMLAEIEGQEFLNLIRYRDGGTLVLTAPAALLASGTLIPAELGNSQAAGWAEVVTVVYRQPDGGSLSVKNMAVASTDDFQERASYELRSNEGTIVVPGNSGGGIWQDGELIGNMWTTWVAENQDNGDLRPTSSSRAAQLPALSW